MRKEQNRSQFFSKRRDMRLWLILAMVPILISLFLIFYCILGVNDAIIRVDEFPIVDSL